MMVPTVIKIGGESIDDYLQYLCDYIQLRVAEKEYTPLVYGWGKALTKSLSDVGIASEWYTETADRITTPQMMPYLIKIAEEYGNKLVEGCLGRGVKAELCTDIFQAAFKELPGVKYKHLNGDVVNVDAKKIESLLDRGVVPVISPLGRSANSELNINGDSAAGQLVRLLKPKMYIQVTVAGGVLVNNEPVHELHLESSYEQLISSGEVHSGMKKKLYEDLELLRGLKKERGECIIRITHPMHLLAEPGTKEFGTVVRL